MVCPNCKNEVTEDSVFCEKCGTRIKGKTKNTSKLFLFILLIMQALAIVILVGWIKNMNTEIEKKEVEIEKLENDVIIIRDSLHKYIEKFEEADSENSFFESRLVFVNNDGSIYYHQYDCDYTHKGNCTIFEEKIAKELGYAQCEKCKKYSFSLGN